MVDDDADDRLLLRLAFEQVLPHLSVIYLSSADEAVQYLRACWPPPALLITDLNMPQVDGPALITCLRQTEGYRLLPVVVLSTCSEAADQRRCYRAGANAFLTKPATLPCVTDLVQAIGRVWLGLSAR